MSNPLSQDPSQNLLPSASFSALNWEPQEPNPAVILQSDLLIGHINQNPNITALTPNPSDSLLLSQIQGSIATIDPNITLPNDNSFDGLTGEAMDIVKEQLTQFAKVPNFVEKMNLAFGESWDNQAANVLTQDWLNGDFSLIPPVKFVSSAEIGGANGAFAAATDTIYLSRELLAGNGANSATVADVLLEEIGHSVDSRLNITDSQGDEGAIFAAVVQGKELSLEILTKLKLENDQVAVTIDGESLIIENNISIGINQILSSSLSTTDSTNPTRGSGYYKDDYSFTGITAGQSVKVNLNSSAFDAYLQIINQSTGTVVTQNDDANGTNNSEVTFNPQSGVNYLARVTSYSAGATGAYSIVTSSNLTKPTVSLTTTDSSAAETTSGQTANPGRFTVTRTGITTNPLTVYYTTGGTAIKGTDYQNLIGSVTIPAGSTTATIPINVIDDGLVEVSETAIINLSANTNYNSGTGGNNIDFGDRSGTVTIADNDVNIPSTSWKAEYFNNISLSGTPVFTENLGSGSQGFSKNWSGSSPASSIPVDNFSGRMTTQRYFAPGLYQIKVQADDGVRVKIGNESVIDRWLSQSFVTNSGYFRSNGGTVPITVDYYEQGGDAAINLSITLATKFQDSVDPTTQWKSTVYSRNSSQGTPLTNFWEGDIYSQNAIGVINLGSNTRSDGKKGINVNWGQGAPNGDGNRLPHDFFAMRSYTQADFDGSPYKFRVQGDDGFQLLAKNQGTGQWYNITPANQWTQNYSPTEITYQLPAGRYYMHFHQYEGGGDARFDLSWEKAQPSIDNSINQYFSNITGWSTKSLVEKWDRIGGSSAQYGQYANFVLGDQWTNTIPAEVLKVYEDLSKTIFREVQARKVNAGYAYDEGYHSTYGAHSGIDIQTEYRKPLYSATKGVIVHSNYYYNSDGSHNGRWIAVDELTGDGQRTGRRWWYGHLDSDAIVTVGQAVQPGQQIGVTGDGTGYKHHLHLTVVNTYGGPPTNWNEVINGKNKGSYANDVADVLNRTVSPLHAYWKSTNGIKE